MCGAHAGHVKPHAMLTPKQVAFSSAPTLHGYKKGVRGLCSPSLTAMMHAGSEKQEGQAKPVKKLTDAESVIEKHKEKAKRAREQEDKWLGVQNNMAVYVTGLPDDTTEAELVQVC